MKTRSKSLTWLDLTGTGLILAGFQGYHVVECSHLHSCQNSPHRHKMKISRVTSQSCLQGRLLSWVVSVYWVISGLGTVDAPAPKPIKLRPAARPSAENTTNNTATGRTARAFVVHGMASLGSIAVKILEVDGAFRTKGGGDIGVRWLLKGSRRWGKTATSLVVFTKRGVPTAI